MFVPPDHFLDVPQQCTQLRVLVVQSAPLPLRAALLPQLLEEEAKVRLLRERVSVAQLGYGHADPVRLQGQIHRMVVGVEIVKVLGIIHSLGSGQS